MTQAHGSTLWQEPAGSGATPTLTPVVIVAAGADYAFSTTAPAAAILITDGAGGAELSTTLTLPAVRQLVQVRGDTILY